MKSLPKCDPLPPAVMEAAREAEIRVSAALDRLLALRPPAPVPVVTLLDEHRAMNALIRADWERPK